MSNKITEIVVRGLMQNINEHETNIRRMQSHDSKTSELTDERRDKAITYAEKRINYFLGLIAAYQHPHGDIDVCAEMQELIKAAQEEHKKIEDGTARED